MRDQLETFYEQELYHIRTQAAQFARERPKIADRLIISAETGESADPHVERLIESFAFLTARIRLKLEDQFPELTDALLSILYPHYLAPVPSMAVVQFHLDPDKGQLTGGYTIPRHSRLYSRPVGGVPCRFRTAYPTTLWPVQLVSARYQTAPFGPDVQIPAGLQNSQALIRIELQATGGASFGQLDLDRLRFFLSGDDRTVHQLYELLFNQLTGAQLRTRTGDKRNPPALLPHDALHQVGFGRDEGLLPYDHRSFLGYRLLTEYFTFPDKFLFVDVTGLNRAAGPPADRLEILFFLKTADTSLETRVDEQTFRLGCTPVINLFSQPADPIHLSQTKIAYPVTPDVRHPRAMEIYSIDSVSSTNLATGQVTEYEPFFACRHGTRSDPRHPYWYARRTASPYKNDAGTEVSLSLVDLEFNPRLPAASVLNVTTTCTNRDLPGELQTSGGENWGFQLEAQAPLRRIDPVVLPTMPARLPLDQSRWRLISHLSLNHLSIADEEDGADALREILKLYDFTNSRVVAQHIAGIDSVRSQRKTARITDGLFTGFCRGVEITIDFDPEKYAGTGMYLFASVLDRFLGLYASINSFTRTITRTKNSEQPFKRWPHRTGEQIVI